MRPHQNTHVVAAEQIRALLPDVPGAHADGPVPWLVFDAGYDPVPLTQARGETPAVIVVRLRAGRCCSADPSAQPKRGRRRRHGHKFSCEEAQTWPRRGPP